MFQSLNKSLLQPVPPLGLAIFRICFGVILLWDVLRIFRINLIESFYPRGIVFPYVFVKLPLVDETLFKIFLWIMSVACILVVLGIFYRLAIITFTLLLAYIFFLDQTLYNNHIYLIIILGFVMFFLPADSALSFNKKRSKPFVPHWTYLILKFQLSIVYFYGGLAKLNVFWLSGHLTKEILANKFGELQETSFIYSCLLFVITYGGIFFDLFIGFLLLKKSTRKFAVPLAVSFNIFNAFVFDDIYIFPFFMISALILFLDQNELAKRFSKTKIDISNYNLTNQQSIFRRLLPFISLYIIWQLCMPLRHYIVDGYTDWTGDYQQFSWRMKIQSRKINKLEFSFIDDDKKMIYPIELNSHLYQDEILNMINRPQMMVYFAKYLESITLEKNDIKNYRITCNSDIDFNGIKQLSVFSTDLNLCKINPNDNMNKWVLPLNRQ